MKNKILRIVFSLILAGMIFPKVSHATADEIVIGNTAPYSGPLAILSTMAKVEAAYFTMVNDQNMLKKKIKFITLDDAFSPPKTLEHVRKLVEQDNALLIFGNMGTPTNLAIWDYLQSKKVPHLFYYSGASELIDPEKHPWSVPFSVSYISEASVIGSYIAKNKPEAKIGVLYQNDGLGQGFLAGLKQGLGANQKMIVSEQSYQVTDPTVDSQILKLKNSGADTIVYLATGKFAVQAMKKVHAVGWRPAQFAPTPATSVAQILKPVGKDAANGIMSVRSIKNVADPKNANDAAVKDYVAFMKKYLPGVDPTDEIAIAGAVQAQLMVYVLKKAGDDLSRENLVKIASNLKDVEIPLLMPGVKLNSSPKDYNLIKDFRLVQYDGEKMNEVGDIIHVNSK